MVVLKKRLDAVIPVVDTTIPGIRHSPKNIRQRRRLGRPGDERVLVTDDSFPMRSFGSTLQAHLWTCGGVDTSRRFVSPRGFVELRRVGGVLRSNTGGI